jgi:hypothetical protein
MFSPGGGMKGPSDQSMNDEGAKLDSRDSEMTIQIKHLSDTIDLMKRPTGTDKKNPARSCLDLYLAGQSTGERLVSTWYWVDPNAGCEADAIQVFCDFSTLETCVQPSNGKVNNGTHHRTPTSEHVYFGNMQNGYKFDYEPKEDKINGASYESQITFLRLLSTQARQTVTYHCKNSVAYSNNAGGLESALKLLGASGVEFSAQGAAQYRVLEDGCKEGSANWDKTIFEYSTTKTARLPIVDVAPLDIGRDDQQFGIEMGPVCFK